MGGPTHLFGPRESSLSLRPLGGPVCVPPHLATQQGTLWSRAGPACLCDLWEVLPSPVVRRMCSTHPSQLSMATGAPLHPPRLPWSLLTPWGGYFGGCDRHHSGDTGVTCALPPAPRERVTHRGPHPRTPPPLLGAAVPRDGHGDIPAAHSHNLGCQKGGAGTPPGRQLRAD